MNMRAFALLAIIVTAITLLVLSLPSAMASDVTEEPTVSQRYDRFQDRTTITLVFLTHRELMPNRIHAITLLVGFEGDDMPPLDDLQILVGWQTVGRNWLFRDQRQGLEMTLLAHDDRPDERDPEPVRESWPLLDHQGQLERAGRLMLHKETLAFTPSDVSTWQRLLAKGHLELQIGTFEMTFSQKQRNGFQQFIDHLKQQQP